MEQAIRRFALPSELFRSAAATLLSGKSISKAPNQFAMDDRGNTVCQKPILPDNKTMSAQEILIEEIRRQPEPVAREVLHYLKFLERQRAQEDWADVLPSREVEQEKLDLLDGK